MTSILELVERFEPGNTFTVVEFIAVLQALRLYADEGDAFDVFAHRNLGFAHTLNQK